MSSPWFFLNLVTTIAITVPPTPLAEARAFFVFADSLVDNGNNNYLATTARADSPPYGIDYPTHRPTGRFSNGLNLHDIISEQIGSEPTLQYLSPELRGQKLLGANFASAGIGILNDTGIQFYRTIRLRPSRVSHAEQEPGMCAGNPTSSKHIQPFTCLVNPTTQLPARLQHFHFGQCLFDEHGLHLQPSKIRFRDIKGSMLWARTLQWTRIVHRIVESVPRPRRLRFPPDTIMAMDSRT
ncbi:hypothetical protein HRI_003536000 [Hibiscus trionum]|uniref:GDSL esterase/lipase n=1 Tax=Hibiscus trionum TaxID=183268 RepID=A0A9W7IL98_HIBTR|nr:hypothetical protein HRI_003536000 [Hibiscus trionum]